MRSLIALAVATWLCSLLLPAAYYHYAHAPPGPVWRTPTDVYSGWDMFESGVMGLFLWNFAWFANLFAFAALAWALARPRQPWVSGSLALCALMVGYDAVNFTWMPGSSGMDGHVDRLGPAFPVWEASFLLLALSQAVAIMQRRTGYGVGAGGKP